MLPLLSAIISFSVLYINIKTLIIQTFSANTNDMMPFFSRALALRPKIDSNPESSPPPYEDLPTQPSPGTRRKSAGSLHIRESIPKHTSTITYQELQDCNEIADITIGLANRAETFKFSSKKVEIRRCKGLSQLIKKHNSKKPLILGLAANEDTFTHEYAPKAMWLLEHWVATGRLKPTIKHTTGEWEPYVLLNIMAHRFSCEKLQNESIDEVIYHMDSVHWVPNLTGLGYFVAMSKTGRPVQMEKLMLDYIALSSTLADHLNRIDEWESLGPLQLSLTRLLAHNSKRQADLVLPSMRNSCSYHIHKETEVCEMR